MGKKYRERSPETIARNREASADARKKVECGDETPFGPRACIVQRQEKQARIEAALMLIPDSSGEQEMLNALLSHQNAARGDVADTIAMAKALDARQGKLARGKVLADEKLVREDAVRRTPAALQDLSQVFPGIQQVADRLVAVPPQLGIQLLDVKTQLVSEDAELLLQWLNTCHEKGHHPNLASCFDSLWEQLHDLKSGPNKDVIPEKEESLCWQANLCLHTLEGKRVLRARNSILSVLKTAYARSVPSKRSELANGLAFAVFVGRSMLALKVRNRFPFPLILVFCKGFHRFWLQTKAWIHGANLNVIGRATSFVVSFVMASNRQMVAVN